MSDVIDPLSPDAPLIHLLSIKHNPLVKDMSSDQLAELVKKLRTFAASAATLSAKLQTESDAIKPRNTKSAKRKALLNSL